VICSIGLFGFAIDMLVKPISNAGLILLLAASTPWVLKTVKRLKVGDYIEFENLTLSEAERKLKSEAVELLEDAPHVAEQPPADDGQTAQQNDAPANIAPILPDVKRVMAAMREINLTERMVLDWLEGQLGVEIKRNVRLGQVELDGVALTSPAPTLVEIKAIQSPSGARKRFHTAIVHLRKAKNAWRQSHGGDPELLIIFTTNAQPDQPEYLELQRVVTELEDELVPVCDVKVVSITDIGLAAGWFKHGSLPTFTDWTKAASTT
jgi:Holliday junction resolvase-like predicted endonuclease